jgi:dTDP-4-dehydrorhamnose reductase
MQRVVVAGATGSIGGALTARLRDDGREVIGVSRTAPGRDDLRLDVTAASSTWPAWPRADVTYICVGCGGLETCERDPAGTRRVHVDAVAELARHATAAGHRVVFVSSSHVFDGTQAVARALDPPRPQTAYGRQKADAEAAVLAQPGAAVLRCSKIIGADDLRLSVWRTALLAGQPVVAFDDLPVAPLSMEDAVTALIDIGDAGQPGIFQLSGRDETTYFSLALALAGHLGVDERLVLPARAETAGVPPAFCPHGVRLEQTLPHPVDVAPPDVVIARALASPRW